MRLLFVITGTGRGGAETQVVTLANHFKERGYEVGLISLLPPMDFSGELQRKGIRFDSLQMKRGRPSILALLRFIWMVRRYRPELIHSHMVHANLLARLGRIFYGKIPLVNTAHSIFEGGKSREIAYRLSDRMCDRFTIISEAARERYVKVGAAPPHRIITVPNGVDTTRFRRDAKKRSQIREELNVENHFVWLAVGRFEAVKAYDLMLRAFASALERSPESVLLIAGNGPLLDQMVAFAGELGIASNVRFLGKREDVHELMSAADSFVLCSLYEGMPMVLLEAASCELPAVATSVGGNPEVIVRGKTGLLVDPCDAQELSKGMMMLMKMPENKRAEMGSEARKYVLEKYSLEKVADDWEAIYSRVANIGRRK